MPLNRRHFDAIAKAAKANRKPSGDLASAFLHELADILETVSGTFQKDRFLAAAGVATVKESQNATTA